MENITGDKNAAPPADHNGDIIRFLDAISDKTANYTRHLDMQINVLIGLGMGIFALSINQILGEGTTSLSFLILAIFSSFTTIVGLLAIHPPRKMRKKGQRESPLYNKKISAFATAEEYAGELKRVYGDPDNIFLEFSTEIYNLAKYYYRPKRKLHNLARNIFVIGVIASFITFLFEIIIKHG